jgi:hypothetical protein
MLETRAWCSIPALRCRALGSGCRGAVKNIKRRDAIAFADGAGAMSARIKTPPELYELTGIFFDLQAHGLRLWDEYHRSDDLKALQAYANFVRAMRAHLGLVTDDK